MKKRLCAILLAGSIGLSLAGCSGSGTSNSTSAGGAASGSSTDYPNKSITMIIPYDAGGGSDLIARRVCAAVEQQTGWTITCTNMPGGSGATGYAELQSRENDGYTLLSCTSTIVTMKQMGILEIDHHDFEVIAGFNQEICVLAVNANWADQNGVETLEDFIDYSKEHPGEVTIGSSAVGGIWNLDTLAAARETGCEWNIVPNAGGGAQAAINCAGGSVQACTAGAFEVYAQVDAGAIRVLGAMSDERVNIYPDTQTFQEIGYDVSGYTTRSILAPKGTDSEIVSTLEEAFMNAVQSEEFTSFCEEQGSLAWKASGQDAFDTYEAEKDIYATVI